MTTLIKRNELFAAVRNGNIVLGPVKTSGRKNVSIKDPTRKRKVVLPAEKNVVAVTVLMTEEFYDWVMAESEEILVPAAEQAQMEMAA